MASCVIAQKPLERTLPIGQQVMFTVSNDSIVASSYKVKFVAEVRVSDTAINPNVATDLIGTFKTTPNNKGVGMFDLRAILETFIKPDNEPSKWGSFKGITANTKMFPIHLIDKYSQSYNSIKFFQVRFLVEYAASPTGLVGDPAHKVDSNEYLMFNGVLQYDDILNLSMFGDYGYLLNSFELTDTDSHFLSNAPTTQYARLEDYGTLPFLDYEPLSTNTVDSITVTYYKADGSPTAGVSDTITNTTGTGGSSNSLGSNTRLIYFGAFPANLQNWSSNFALAMADDLAYYTVQAFKGVLPISKIYTINILCDINKGYAPIRLTWLNQWGTWDYYTFNMKSTKSVKTKRISYTQLEGTWNESIFKISDYKGGKKNFRVNSTESIKINTDFVSEAESEWFEELMNSTEVYIISGFSADTYNTITNKYIEPITVKTSSYIRKTMANDRLIQYTFEIDKTRVKRTQAV